MRFNLPDEVYSLGLGETANGLICPVCGGGTKRDRSFSCTRVEGGFVYHCFRAKCSHGSGFSSWAGNVAHARGLENRKEVPAKQRPYVRPIEFTPSEVAELVRQRYRILPETLDYFGVGWSPPQDDRVGRLVIPVLRPDGSQGGLVARALDKTDEPKSLTFIPRPGCMSWFSAKPDVVRRERLVAVEESSRGSLWVVEDQFSAMRLWQEGVSAVALLGTHINHERAVELSSVTRNVVIALDKDATNKAIAHAAQFRYALDAKVVALTKDVKDLDEKELKELLNDI